MIYSLVRKQAKTGDVLAVRGTGIASKLIRVLTGESYSHVAMLVWLEQELYVYEFVEGVGYQSMPASEWMRRRKGQSLYFCKAPIQISEHRKAVADAALSYRNGSVVSRMYGWFSLVKVWLSQVAKVPIPVHQRVCSTFIQFCWKAGSVSLSTTADPGDIVYACPVIHKIYFPSEGESNA